MTASRAVAPAHITEEFTDEERAILSRYFTNTDLPVFGIVNLPEVVKGALFARYSRSPKSVRRLFLDEFYDEGTSVQGLTGLDRAEALYQRVFTDYGDDSVAQLGGVHLACEQASNILTKVLEWGRLAAYLEQSTRYIYYDDKPGGRYRFATPPEIEASPLAERYSDTMTWLFDTYSEVIRRLVPYLEQCFPQQEGDSDFVWRASIRAQACDAARGLLPAATTSNVGIYATGQAYEMLLLRMRAHPLAEVRQYGDLMLTELRKMIPAFLKRVDVPDRGQAWSDYLATTAARMRREAAGLGAAPEARPEVTLVEWDPDAETKLAAAALYGVTDLPDDQLQDMARAMSTADRRRLLLAYVGERGNRRHKPGRAFERIDYRFDILCDYGIFRDLQRHRMLTMEWQYLGVTHGFVTPEAIEDVDAAGLWNEAMERTADLHAAVAETVGTAVAQYVVPFAYRIRFYMQLNAREAMHMIELRSAQGGHPDYRRVVQEMHRLIRDQAGHALVAEAMKYVDHNEYDLGRLASERRAEAKRAALGSS